MHAVGIKGALGGWVSVPPLLHPGSGGGRITWGSVGSPGVPLPTKEFNHTDLQIVVTFSYQAHEVSLSVLCRAAEQGHHVQSTLFFPGLPPGKVSGRSYEQAFPLSPLLKPCSRCPPR